MTFYSVSNPFMQVLNLQGTGLNDGDVYFGVAGQDPITHPISVYWDLAGTQLAPQPIETTGGYLYRSGTPAAVYLDDTYSIKVLDKNGALVYYEANVFDPVFEIAQEVAALATPSGAGKIGFSQAETYAAATLGLHNQLVVCPNDAPWLATGDGGTDDTTAWVNMMSALQGRGGGHVICVPGANYVLKNQIDVWDDITVNLNGATVTHAFANGTNYAGFLMHNNTELFGGTTAMGAGTPGSPSGQYFTNVVTGVSTTVPIGYNNIQIHDLTVTNLRADAVGGTGILVFGSSTNVDVYNITYPSSATVSGGVRVTWCGDGGSPAPAVSAHPGNVRVWNIKGGTMTKATNGTGDVAFIDIVAAYNVTVDTVTLDEWRGDAVFQVRAGAFGSAVAPASVQAKFLKGIKVNGVTCAKTYNRLSLVNGRSHGGGAIPETLYSIPAEITNCFSVGAGASCLEAGFETTYTTKTIYRNCEARDHYRGVFIQENTAYITVEDSKFFENWHEGVVVANATTPPEDITLRNVDSRSNGQGGSDKVGFHLESCTRVTIENCTAGATGETVQTIGFQVAAGSIDTQFLGRNRVRDVAAGGTAYSFAVAVLGAVKLSGGTSAALGTSGVANAPLCGTGSAANALDAGTLMQPMVLTNFRVNYSTAPTDSRQARVVVNGTSTNLDITTTGTDTKGQSYNAVTLAADSVVYVQNSIPSGTPVASRAQWSCEGILI